MSDNREHMTAADLYRAAARPYITGSVLEQELESVSTLALASRIWIGV